MKRTIITALAFAIVALTTLPKESGATYYTGRGAKASFNSQSNAPLGTAIAPNGLNTSISKALAGTVLTIQVSVAVSGASADIEPYVLVFPGCGDQPEPTLNGPTVQSCHAGEYCVFTMNYFCDIDKADADNGGGVIGSRINTSVLMFEENSAPAGATVSWSVSERLESKN